MLVSYAQNFEDVILWRALKHVKRGFYIDIGAQDPVIDSVSLAFYEQGWRGVHVEPSSFYADLLRAARPGEEVVEAAISDTENSLRFFEFPHTGLSTGDETVARAMIGKGFEYRLVQVPCLSLSQLLDAHKDKDISWMKIDVEGMERAVIASWLPSAVRPQIVVVESTLPMTSTPSHTEWESQIIRLGYSYVFFDGVNRYYVSNAHPKLMDDFGLRIGVFDGVVLSGRASSPAFSAIKAKETLLESQLRASEEARISQARHLFDSEQSRSASTQEIAVLKNQIAALEQSLHCVASSPRKYFYCRGQQNRPMSLKRKHLMSCLRSSMWPYTSESRPKRALWRRTKRHAAYFKRGCKD
jgi:FkbM family methyltransferase